MTQTVVTHCSSLALYGEEEWLYEIMNVIRVYWKVDKAAYLIPLRSCFYQSCNPSELAATLLSTEAVISW